MPQKMTMEVVEITPSMAEVWLNQSNVNNRTLSNYRVKRYAEDMKAGDWKMIGDPIRFSKTGKLLDGQHRLWACFMSGATFKALVIRGMEDSDQLLMDQGLPRTRGSQLQLLGYKHSRTLAAAATALWRMEMGRSTILAQGQTPSNSEVLHLIEDNPVLQECLNRYMAHKRTSGIGVHSGTVIAMYVYMRRYNAEKADAFIEQYLTGVGLSRGDAPLTLRDRIMQHKTRGHRVILRDMVTWVAYSWRAFAKGKKLTRITAVNTLPEFPGSPPWDEMDSRAKKTGVADSDV